MVDKYFNTYLVNSTLKNCHYTGDDLKTDIQVCKTI